MSDDWGRKFSKFGNDLAAGLKDTGKLLKNDIDKARGHVAEQGQQSEAERQAALALGYVTEDEFAQWVVPLDMTHN